MKLIHSLISLEEGWRPHLPSKSLCASCSQVRATSSARAKVNAFRHVGQTKSHPQPHQGQSIWAGAPTTVWSHAQWEMRPLLAFTRKTTLLVCAFGIAVFGLAHPNPAHSTVSTPAPTHARLKCAAIPFRVRGFKGYSIPQMKSDLSLSSLNEISFNHCPFRTNFPVCH